MSRTGFDIPDVNIIAIFINRQFTGNCRRNPTTKPSQEFHCYPVKSKAPVYSGAFSVSFSSFSLSILSSS